MEIAPKYTVQSKTNYKTVTLTYLSSQKKNLQTVSRL